MYGGVGHLVQVEAGDRALRESSPETVRGGYPFVRGVSGARQTSLQEALLRRSNTWKFRLREQVRFFSIKERKQDEEGDKAESLFVPRGDFDTSVSPSSSGYVSREMAIQLVVLSLGQILGIHLQSVIFFLKILKN